MAIATRQGKDAVEYCPNIVSLFLDIDITERSRDPKKLDSQQELKALQAEIVQMRSALEMHQEDMFQAKNERNILQQELERERGEQEMERDRLAAQIDEAHDKARNLHRQLISEKETGARQRESAMHVARHLQEHIHSTAEEVAM